MNLDGVFSIAALIVGVAMVTTIVARPNSANVIRAGGDAFAGSLRAAMNLG